MAFKEKLQEYALIAEIVSALAIVTSLVFVGLEINRSNELSESEARQTWNGYAGDALLILAENGELAAIVQKDRNNEALTELERFRLYVFWQRAFNLNNWAFYNLALPDLELQEANIGNNFAALPSMAWAWEQLRERYPSEFVTWMDGLRASP